MQKRHSLFNIIKLSLILSLTLSLVLSGCASKETEYIHNGLIGGASAPNDYVAKDEYVADMENVGVSGGVTKPSSSGEPNISTDQKMIRTVSIDVETEDIDSLIEKITDEISKISGYIELQQTQNGSMYSSYTHKNTEMTIRVPADKLDSFVEEIEGSSHVTNLNQSQENVTLTYTATENRIKALEAEEGRLLELLEEADNMTDLLAIEARLTEVRYDLENITSKFRVLSNQIEYATVNLFISQVKEYTVVEEQTLLQRIAKGFKDGLNETKETLEDVLVWIASNISQLLILTIILSVTIILGRKRIQKRKVKETRMDVKEEKNIKNPQKETEAKE